MIYNYRYWEAVWKMIVRIAELLIHICDECLTGDLHQFSTAERHIHFHKETTMELYSRIGLITLLACGLSACDPSAPQTADTKMANAQAASLAQANAEVTLPTIKNFTEKKIVHDIYEMRDDPHVLTWSYMQGIDGRLICLGRSVGYGIPYGVQFSNPQVQSENRFWTHDNDEVTMPQAEPNGLFMPETAEGTWLQLVNPENPNEVKPVYIEPRVTVSPFRLRGKAVSQDCE